MRLPFILFTLVILVAFCGRAIYDSSAFAEVWLDVNGNGQKDEGDSPIENICIWAITRPDSFDEKFARNVCGQPDPDHEFHSDSEGHVPGKVAVGGLFFFAGAKCSDIYIYVIPPEGFRVTTPEVINGCYANFGLTPDIPSSTDN